MSPGMEILSDLLLLISLGVVIVILFHRLRIPPIVGFLLTGVISGPHGLGLVSDVHEVEVLAELGVVLLLFTVGIEFSLEKLLRLRLLLLVGGGVQVGLTTAVGAFLAHAAGIAWPKAVFLGMLLALSSTAIVIRLLAERGEVDTLYGRASVAILIFQDLCVVPMVLLVPFLAGGNDSYGPVAFVALKALAFVAAAVLAARYVVPSVFRLAVSTRRRDVFVLTVVLLCLGAAWFSALAGLSLALGAFIAGLVLSESEYGVQALGEALPFREVFNSIFFISVGLLLDVRTVLNYPLWVLGSVTAIVVLKGALAGAAALVLGYSVRVAAATGLALSQIGEFSFVLSREGIDAGLLARPFEQIFLASAVFTMAITPFLHYSARRALTLTGRLARWKFPLSRIDAAPQGEGGPRGDHVVIVGYGMNGRNLSRVLTSVGIPFTVVETNPFTVKKEREAGVPIVYGDASTAETLHLAGVERAKVLVAAISDAAATRRVVDLARRLNPRLYLIARTRYVEEVRAILALGAQEVIPEEFETSVEIFARVLSRYLVPRDRIERCVREVRQGAYEMLRSPASVSGAVGDVRHYFRDISFEVYRVEEGCPVAGRSLGDTMMRTVTGATLVALQRAAGEVRPNPDVSERFSPGDLAVVLGSPAQLVSAAALFRGPPAP